MPAPLPHRYCATLCRTFSPRARADAPPRSGLLGGSPLGGPPLTGSAPDLTSDVDNWSPEQMLLSSLGLCMLKTFEVFAARDGLDVLACRATVNGLVEQTPDGPNFTSIVVELDIDLAGDVAQVEGTLEDAKNYCIVHNALRVPIVVETQVRTPVTFAGNLAELPPQPRHEIVRGHQLRAM